MAASITPGPANIAVLSVADGKRNILLALPFIAGVCSGFAIVLLACLLPMTGLSLIPKEFVQPVLTLVQCIGAVYLIHLAWKMFYAERSGTSQLIGFWHGLIIHPLSIKAWFFVLSAYSTFVDPLAGVLNSLTYALVFLLCAVVSHSIWLIVGVGVKSQLPESYYRKTNQFLALMLAAMVIYVFVSGMTFSN